MRARLAAVALFSIVLVACVPKGGYLQEDIDTAAAKKKPLVVEFYAGWCGPCKYFEAHVLTDPRVKTALERVEFVRFDADTSAGSDAMRRCGASALPTIVGIDRHGKVRLFKQGAGGGADEFLRFLAQTEAVLGKQWE
jgi:thiol:disulfide interchange protein DsbD